MKRVIPVTKLLKSTVFKIIISVGLTAAVVAGGIVWHLAQPKFQDVTLELGSELPDAKAFQTKFAISALVKQLTDPDHIDPRYVGEQWVDLRHGLQNYSVKLIIQDTVAPAVTFRDVTAYIDELPEAKDFVENAADESEISYSFLEEPKSPESYGSTEVTVLVTDAAGNVTRGQCAIHYVWMERQFQLEFGDKLTKEDLLLRPEQDAHLLDQAVLDAINASGVGTYTVTSINEGVTCNCVVTVKDTVAPKLELQNKKIFAGDSVDAREFIVSASDLAGEVDVKLVTPLDSTTPGVYTLVFEATDVNGNVTRKEATFEVMTDAVGPVFSGVKDMVVEKNSTPDFTKGVKATDARDGQVTFTCDTSKVRLGTAGTYYAVYTAKDSAGNTTTYRRKVTVNYNEDDVLALVQSIARTLPDNDAEAVRDYVRDKIRYSHEWGGKNPQKVEPDAGYVYVWYGLKNKHGNCYVHAWTLDYLLREKGFETQLIWATDKSHYWNMVKINGTWRHIDATPGTRHTKYSLMNDAQRYETLYIPEDRVQRDWDRSQWPTCP